MKKLLIAFGMVSAVALSSFAVDAEYFVDAANGNDASDGSEANPVRSLARVCDLIAAQSPKAALTTVTVLPGHYGEDEGATVLSLGGHDGLLLILK